ncbi:thioredoxin family protein [Mesobacillus maritimus]|uniref:thioredoxin family protein n=1 Tax=Mesobacillus maritimus TaxID=1643336 RepID=UPI00384F0E9B
MKTLNEWFLHGMTQNEYIASMQRNKEEMLGVYNEFHLEDSYKALLQEFQPSGLRALILTADWCGDAMVNLPIFMRIANEALIEPRYFVRDENLDLMDRYLTNGKSRSIPIIVLIDKEGNEVVKWGPRAPEAQRLADELFGSLPPKGTPEFEEAFKKAIPDFQQNLTKNRELWSAIARDLIHTIKEAQSVR